MKNIQLMLITNSPEIAKYAEESGVGRIFIDMEFLGKEERQKNLGLPLNRHTFADVKAVKSALKTAEVMVRINPFNPETQNEVDSAIEAGADCIMLPYFHHKDEVAQFVAYVKGRCKTNILLETSTAVARAESILAVKGLDEIHVGLNDLKLTFKLDFLYESISEGIVEHLQKIAQKNGLSFGIGGMGSISKGSDVPPDLILKEHVRLGSERVILSRAFTQSYTDVAELKQNVDLKKEVSLIREVEKMAHSRTAGETKKDQLLMIEKVNLVTDRLRKQLKQ